MSLKNLNTLEIQSKKRKNTLLIGLGLFILILLGWSVISAVLSVDDSHLYEKRALDKQEEMNIMKEPEFKENWAISMENKFSDQNKRLSQLFDTVESQQNVVLSDLKTLVDKNTQSIKTELELIKENANANISQLKENIDKMKEDHENSLEQIKENQKEFQINTESKYNNQIVSKDLPIMRNGITDELPTMEEIKKMTTEEINKQLSKVLELIGDKKLSEAIMKNPDLSAVEKFDFLTQKVNQEKKSNFIEEPKVEEKPKVEIPKRKKLVSTEIDTSFNKEILQVQNDLEKEIASQKEMLEFEPYHISTGFMKSYMITGAYAPAFQEGSMEPLPVLFESEGDLLMANNTTGNIEKCFLLGSAKGNMNSETADIKLVSINCLINGGEYRIEGTISGWVIGENGTPGLQGEMLHKNGAWLARTFVSGFFETFAGALTGGNTDQINLGGGTNNNGTTNTSDAISNNLLSAGSSGISNVFSKLGDYYLKMAEQIFPVIEVKGGRTVNILLIGGEDLTVVKNNKVDMGNISERASKIENMKKNSVKTVQINAFQKVTMTRDKKDDTISGVVDTIADIPSPL